jgi:allantoicase
VSRTSPADAAFRSLPDLAVRSLGGSVVWANDELFAERENLLRPERPSHDPSAFGPKGKVYDGWETRRRREPGVDEAVVRLGVPGTVHGVVVDTAYFTGNYPPEVSLDATSVTGYPDVEELRAASWESLVPRSAVQGDSENLFATDPTRRWTHVRLRMHPDGGIARLRVHGEPVPDPALLDLGALDLAALENGGRVVGCSNLFYSSPNNLVSPGLARTMGEGWETARRRDDGNDWVVLRLAGAGVARMAELDTTHFKGNAPGAARLTGYDVDDWPADGQAEVGPGFELLPRTRLQPDTRHRFFLPAGRAATHVRLDVYPDGGMARVRLVGDLTPGGRQDLGLRWFAALPEPAAVRELESAGVDPAEARALVAARPLSDPALVPAAARALLLGPAA